MQRRKSELQQMEKVRETKTTSGDLYLLSGSVLQQKIRIGFQMSNDRRTKEHGLKLPTMSAQYRPDEFPFDRNNTAFHFAVRSSVISFNVHSTD